VRRDDVAEVDAPGLLLALDDPLDRDRQFAVPVAQGMDRGEARRDAALVVCGAAGVELAVALGRLERRRVPQIQRAGRLHVVVIVEQQREGGAPVLLAVDDRRRVRDRQPARREAGLAQEGVRQGSHLVDAHAFGGHTGLAAQPLQ